MSKTVRSAQFFYFIPNYGSSEACPQKLNPIGQKLTIWWPKQGSVFEKVKPHRARIIFWKSVKTCPKWLAPPNFFILSPILAQVELAHKKWTKSNQNWRFVDQNKVRCSKKLSLIEQGFFFWKSVKTCPKWFALPKILLYLWLWLKWSLPTKNGPNRTKIDDLVTKTKFDVRKS